MDVFAFMFLAFISLLFGVILTLAVQYYILYIYLKKSPVAEPPNHRPSSVDYILPEALKKQLETDDWNEKKGTNGSSLPISLVLQFLFHELRHSENIKRWLYKKLSLELDELLTKTTIGKFFESITIRDMHLGNQFPDVKDLTVENVKLDKTEGHIEVVSLSLNLDYTGNFLLSVDAKMKFGKTAYLSIKVKKLCGSARLQFTRQPYTHWSFSFYNEPVMELAVESHFQGRQLQSNITNLIVNQIKKAIKRKHCLPNYKIRYKPFFLKTDPSQLDTEDNEIIPQGQLDVSCMELSRLSLINGISSIYCTIAIDSVPWISIQQQSDDLIIMILEVTMTKQRQLGVVFKQDQGAVNVDSVNQHTAAYKSGLRCGDIVIAVENKSVNTVAQVAKFIKAVSSSTVTLRIKRIVDNYVIKRCHDDNISASSEADLISAGANSAGDGDFVFVQPEKKRIIKTPDKMPKIMPTNENMTKLAQTIGNFSLRKRKPSISDKNMSDKSSEGGSAKNTPQSSNPGTPQHVIYKAQSAGGGAATATITKKLSISEVPEIRTEDLPDNLMEVYRGREMPLNETILALNEDYQFNLKDGSKYLNINVWGVQELDKGDVLLAYTNIPLSHVLSECCNSMLGHYIRIYSFLPPTNAPPTSQSHPLLAHSGFEHVFCYGDILLGFVWNHDNDIELKRKMSSVGIEEEEEEEEKTMENGASGLKHDFIRTQFHRTTHCDFCSKKIWLKDAVQCRNCGLCCHKKCIAKCQLNSGCTPIDVKDDGQPEIIMTEIGDEITEIPVTPSSSDLSGMKRVNSVNNLAIPGNQFVSNSSRSLPPSPQRTPSRKQSLVVINPFSMCPSVLDDLQKCPAEASDNVNKLLEQIMLCPPDETLMDAAKETGRQMYANLSHEEKVEKINLMMAELKKTLDTVTLEHMELSKQMAVEKSEVEKAKLAFLMGQADAKVHGLSVLMLHYCSSLQQQQQEKIV